MTRLATKFLLLGGIACLGVAGVAAASPANSEAPALVVRYNTDMLETDSGARVLGGEEGSEGMSAAIGSTRRQSPDSHLPASSGLISRDQREGRSVADAAATA